MPVASRGIELMTTEEQIDSLTSIDNPEGLIMKLMKCSIKREKYSSTKLNRNTRTNDVSIVLPLVVLHIPYLVTILGQNLCVNHLL